MKLKYIIVFLFLVIVINGQVIRKYSNDFLSIGAGARGLSMGGTAITHQEDAYAPMWNPAGLTGVEKNWQGTLMHAEYFESITKYDYMAFAKPLDGSRSVFAFSLVRMGVDNILNTTKMIDQDGNIDYDKISSFSQADYVGLFSFAFYPEKRRNLSLGINTKLIYRNIGSFANGFGFGIDLGTLYKNNSGWQFGLVLKDITTTVNFWSVNRRELSAVVNGQEFNPMSKDKIELTMPKLNIGVGKRFHFSEDLDFLPEVGFSGDFTRTTALLSTGVMSITPYVGAELGFQKMVFVRIGFNRFQSITDVENTKRNISFQPSAGLGIGYRGITLDYAISNSGIWGSNIYSHFFSLKLDSEYFY